MRLTAASIGAAVLLSAGSAAADLSRDDAKRAWFACDDAALDVGFPDAAPPSREIRARIFPGSDKLQELILIDAPTNTGNVFCVLDADFKVLLYTFDGRKIIDRM